MTFPDFEEFIASLNAHRVRYLVVGGYAVGFHARPRATKDIDILVDRSPRTHGARWQPYERFSVARRAASRSPS